MSYYSATTDMWSSRTMQPYTSLVMHIVNSVWTLQSICLQIDPGKVEQVKKRAVTELRSAYMNAPQQPYPAVQVHKD